MQHIDEHTIELYVLGSELVEERRDEIERHFAECHGCRTLAEQIGAFYKKAEDYLAQQPEREMKPGKALVQQRREPMLFEEPLGYPIPYAPRTPIQKFVYFVRRHPVVTGVGGFSLAAALIVFGMLMSNPFKHSDSDQITDHNPAFKNYNTTTDMLEVINAEHQLLWQLKSPSISFELQTENSSRNSLTAIADLDGDGNNELLTSLNILGCNTASNDRHLLVFDRDGKLIWNQQFRENVHYLGRSYSPYFNAAALLVIEDPINGQKNVLVIANHNGRSPSILYRLDNRGKVIGTYWHFGTIKGLYQCDLNGDGNQEIILCAKNDANDTTHGEFASIAVLDPLKIVGERRSTTCPGFDLPPSDAELIYVRFPRVDIDNFNHTSSAITEMETSDSTSFKFVMGNFDNWRFDYFLDHTMRVLETKSYDITNRLHKQLEEQGKTSATVDQTYLENLKNGVRYWDGRKWTKEVTRIDHDKPISMK